MSSRGKSMANLSPSSRLPSQNDSDGAELLFLARAGDTEAWKALLTRSLLEELWRYTYRLLGNSNDAEDVLQEACLRAVRRIDFFRGDASFRTWMYRIVHNVALDSLRRGRSQGLSFDTLDSVELDSVVGGGDELSVAETVAHRVDLERALALLDPLDRSAILLVDGDGFSLRAAALVLGVSYQTISRRCERARTLVRAVVMPADGSLGTPDKETVMVRSALTERAASEPAHKSSPSGQDLSGGASLGTTTAGAPRV